MKELINKEFFYLDDEYFSLGSGIPEYIAFGTKVKVYKVEDEDIFFMVVGNKTIKGHTDDPTLLYKSNIRNFLKIQKAIKLDKQITKLQIQLELITFD